MFTESIASTNITQNLTFTILSLHSLLVENQEVDSDEFRSTQEKQEKIGFLKAIDLLGSGKGSSMFASLISTEDYSNSKQSLIVSFLLKRMGKIAIQMEAVQMNIVFNIFKSVSTKIINPENLSSESADGYAYEMLVPLYKVCESCAGKVIQDEVKQLAQEALETIRDILGSNNCTSLLPNQKSSQDKAREEEAG